MTEYFWVETQSKKWTVSGIICHTITRAICESTVFGIILGFEQRKEMVGNIR